VAQCTGCITRWRSEWLSVQVALRGGTVSGAVYRGVSRGGAVSGTVYRGAS
jgi:hypothetical protein